MKDKGQVPEPLQSLYRDLRDRRLLPLVLVLVAAIVAIPILLSTDPESSTPTAATLSSADAAGEIEGAEIADPVVLAEVPGIRNFRERLDSFRRENPFRQQLTGLPKSVAEAHDEVDREAREAVEGLTESGTGTGTTDSGTSTGGETVEPPKTTTKTFGYFWKIDAKVGVVGEAKKKTGVEMLEFLPGRSHPVVQFIQGIGESGAIFVVSRSVGDTHGDGKCRPRPDNCQFVALEVGQARTFHYEPDGLQYKIKLTGVHLERKEIDPDDVDAFTGDGLDSFLSGD
jgi:hypothetical protein